MARIMLFVGGPCTEGAGKVINRELSEEIRSHKDLAKDGAPHFRKAKKYYDGLALELVTHGHIMDIFSCALDQVSGLGADVVDGNWLLEKTLQTASGAVAR
jgi:protein transport protein SEC23